MKTRFRRLLLPIVAAFLLLAAFLPMGKRTDAEAAAFADPYAYTLKDYSVSIVVEDDLVLHVTERFTAHFTGSFSHGLIRDFPLGGGQTYSEFEASCDNADFSPYTESEGGVLSWYLRGEGLVTGEDRTYTLSYLIHSRLIDGALPIDVLGYGFTADIEHFSARIVLPAGYTGCEVYSGEKGSSVDRVNVPLLEEKEGENTVLSFEGVFPVVSSNQQNGTPCTYGVTLSLHFAEGAVEEAFDTALLYAIVLSGVLVLAAVILRLAVGRQPLLIKTVNLSAPKGMDPLMMGKLIDGKVQTEDLGALVFWFAAKGYLTLDMTDESDPVLTRTEKEIEPDMPAHRKVFLEGLFAEGKGVKKRVHMKELSGSFYPSAQAARHTVEAAAGKLYNGRGTAVLVLVSILAFFIAGVYPLIYGMVTVTGDYIFWGPLFFTALAFVPNALLYRLAVRMRFKWKKWVCVLLGAFGLVIGGVSALLSALLLTGAAMSAAVVAIPIAAAAIAGALAGACLVRTKQYSERLGQILGFRDFILYTEKDRISFMMKEDPELYYDILPYAQVLGVSDVWTEKFEGLDLQPPVYYTCPSGAVFDYLYWSLVFRSFNRSFAVISAPPVSHTATSGHANFGGGGFGGFGGGGFGGGGMRGC